jgi:hypothetical protein
MTDTIEPNDRVDDRDDEDHAATRDEVFASLAAALAHIDRALHDLRDGIETILRGQDRSWAASKRQEAMITDITRVLREGADESQDSQGGGGF